MKTKAVGNLWFLAEKQLIKEVENNKRKDYKLSDIIDYSIIIRKQLDRFGKTGDINRVINIHSHKKIMLETIYDIRHRKYLKERSIL